MKMFVLPIALVLSLTSFSQNFSHIYTNIEPVKFIVTYAMQYQPDSTDPNDIKLGRMLLFIGDSTSKFVSRAFYINDTTTRKFTTVEQLQAYLLDSKRQIPGTLYQIFKNYPKGRITYTEHIPSSTYKYEESIDMFDWILTGDTSSICGFKVYKATCDYSGRSWIAWFSPDLPYNDGPYKFNGLPGLIIKAHDTRNHYCFEMISIEKPAKEIMIEIEKKEYITTTKSGFFHAQDYFREDIINRVKEAGGNSSTQQTAALNMSKRNNPIELKRK